MIYEERVPLSQCYLGACISSCNNNCLHLKPATFGLVSTHLIAICT